MESKNKESHKGCSATHFVILSPMGEKSLRLFAEPVLSEILRSLRSLRMTRSEGLRVTFISNNNSEVVTGYAKWHNMV
jgi:hypothetical protein